MNTRSMAVSRARLAPRAFVVSQALWGCAVGESGPGRFQVVPPLSAEEFAALKTDIELRGVLVPVECDSEGNVLELIQVQ